MQFAQLSTPSPFLSSVLWSAQRHSCTSTGTGRSHAVVLLVHWTSGCVPCSSKPPNIPRCNLLLAVHCITPCIAKLAAQSLSANSYDPGIPWHYCLSWAAPTLILDFRKLKNFSLNEGRWAQTLTIPLLIALFVSCFSLRQPAQLSRPDPHWHQGPFTQLWPYNGALKWAYITCMLRLRPLYMIESHKSELGLHFLVVSPWM